MMMIGQKNNKKEEEDDDDDVMKKNKRMKERVISIRQPMLIILKIRFQGRLRSFRIGWRVSWGCGCTCMLRLFWGCVNLRRIMVVVIFIILMVMVVD